MCYHTSLPVLFGVKKYADRLWEIVKERDINVTLRSNLIEVRFDSQFLTALLLYHCTYD